MDPLYTQALKILDLLETKCGVYNLKAGDIPIWWFIRFKFYITLTNYLESRRKEVETFPNNSVFLVNFAGICLKIATFSLRCLKSFAMLMVYREEKPVWLLAYSSDLKKINKNPTKDINIGPVYQKLKDRAIVIEMPSLKPKDFQSLLLRKGAFFFDAAIIISVIRNFVALIKKPRVSQWDEFKECCRNTDFEGISSDWIYETILGLIRIHYRKVVVQLGAAEFALRKFKPKVIVETGSYDSGMMAMNFIAKSAGVAVIELQHGAITDKHAGYIYFMPREYPGKIPLPNKLLVYGQVFKDLILASSKAFLPKDVVVIGNVRMEKFLRENASEKKTIKKWVRLSLGISQDAFLVTVSSQPVSRAGLSLILEETLPVLGKGIIICIKPHPTEDDWQQAYKNILSHSQVKVITDNDVDLYDLLVASDVHVTLFSTIFLECFALGVPNIILDSPSSEEISEFMNSCGISFVKTANEFIDEIDKIRRDKQYKNAMIEKGKKISRSFFADTGYPENLIVKEISKILK